MNGGGDDGGGGGGGLVPALVVVVAGGAAAAGATQTSQTGPILAFTAALLVALIAASTAGRRQVRALQAEGQRQADRLSHERQLQDVEHLREFLDEAAAAYEDAHSATSDMAVDLLTARRSPGLHEAATRASIAVGVMRRRVGLRFSPEHPVSVAYGNVSEHVDARVGFLLEVIERLGPNEGMTEGDDKRDDELSDQAREAFGRFADAARDEVGARADRSPGEVR